MTRHTERRLILLPAAAIPAANTALSARGYGTPFNRLCGTAIVRSTHAVCCWAMTPAELTEVTALLTPLGATYRRVGDGPNAAYNGLAALGMERESTAAPPDKVR